MSEKCVHDWYYRIVDIVSRQFFCIRCGEKLSMDKFSDHASDLEKNADALKSRVAELEAAQRWVPVSERLPEDRATVLVAFKNREILTATYYKHYKGFGGVDNWWDIAGWHYGDVTHWMPLPQPPEEREI